MTKPHIVNLRSIPLVASVDSVPVHGANARALPLHRSEDGVLGSDVLWVPPSHSFPVHVHPGHHLLLCMAGEGSISVAGETYIVHPGDLYMVPGDIPHAVGATEAGHMLLSIGSPHKPVDSPERMVPTDWNGTRVMVPVHADGGPMCFCGVGEQRPAEDHRPPCPRGLDPSL